MKKSKTYLLFPRVIKNSIPVRDWLNFRKCRHDILKGEQIDGIKVVYKHKLFHAWDPRKPFIWDKDLEESARRVKEILKEENDTKGLNKRIL